jgi:hypothetical protein
MGEVINHQATGTPHARSYQSPTLLQYVKKTRLHVLIRLSETKHVLLGLGAWEIFASKLSKE